MEARKILVFLFASQLLLGSLPAAEPPSSDGSPAPLPTPILGPAAVSQVCASTPDWCSGDTCCGARGCLESDHAFDGFIGPISNPVLTKDPRSLTEARLLFVNDVLPGGSPLTGGDFQAYGLQLRLALTDRLTLIADKDGYATINPSRAPATNGWLNLAAGLKYAVVRDVEDQFLVSVGLMFEPQTGESAVYQGQGTGLFTFFGTVGKEFGTCNHAILNLGYQVPVDESQNSSFYYTQLHLDRQMVGWIYPLVELNWFHWVASGDHGLPPALGEGDGLLNLGTSGVAGNDLVTCAVGLKAKLSPHADVGAAWEFPISNQNVGLLGNRLVAEFILRY